MDRARGGARRQAGAHAACPLLEPGIGWVAMVSTTRHPRDVSLLQQLQRGAEHALLQPLLVDVKGLGSPGHLHHAVARALREGHTGGARRAKDEGTQGGHAGRRMSSASSLVGCRHPGSGASRCSRSVQAEVAGAPGARSRRARGAGPRRRAQRTRGRWRQKCSRGGGAGSAAARSGGSACGGKREAGWGERPSEHAPGLPVRWPAPGFTAR